ncbi:MAG TPA: helix-turn-helix domain-containing protein [Candidatus Andersenbacteria bacterium]|nr:helix-turn-helix domain-containing protein [Candidatus Andersenbacteria bacterium]
MNNLEFDLQKVGFDEREAKVYLACLELGPSPVQKIAQRAETPRATVYLVLDDLQNKGVVTTYDEGKKTYYVAEPPQKIADLVDKRALKVKQQQETLKSLIPELTSRGQFEKGESSIVKYYQGDGGLRGYVKDIFQTEGNEILSYISHEESDRIMAQMGIAWSDIAEWRKKKQLKRKLIVVGNDINFLKKIHKSGDAVYLTNEQLKLKADIDIIGDVVGFMPYLQPFSCVLIHDKSIADTMRNIFLKTWEALK